MIMNLKAPAKSTTIIEPIWAGRFKFALPFFYSDYEHLLIEPTIVDKSYWSKGYFYTIGNEMVSDLEQNLDYGFYSIGKQKYYKENGEIMDHQPLLLGTYGIATITGIASDIEKELIFYPTLLEF